MYMLCQWSTVNDYNSAKTSVADRHAQVHVRISSQLLCANIIIYMIIYMIIYD